MTSRNRRNLSIALLIAGVSAVLVMAYELATSGYWRTLWMTVSVTLVLAGVTILVSEIRASQLATVRAEVHDAIRQLRLDLQRLTLSERTQPLPVLQAVVAGPSPVTAKEYVGRAPVPVTRPDIDERTADIVPISSARRPSVLTDEIPPDNVRAFELGRRIGRADAPTMPPA